MEVRIGGIEEKDLNEVFIGSSFAVKNEYEWKRLNKRMTDEETKIRRRRGGGGWREGG